MFRISTSIPPRTIFALVTRPLQLSLALFFAFTTGCGQPDSSISQGSLSRADILLESGNVDAAIAEYRVLLHRDSLDPILLVRLSKAYVAQGNRDLADTYLRRGTNIPYERGVEALGSNDETQAKLAFEETVSLHPTHPLALNHLGDIHYRRGDIDSALVYYESSARGFVNFPATHLRLGQLYLLQNMPENAKQSFERTIELDINAFEAYMELGRLHLDRENWQEAVARFDNALVINPRSSAALNGRNEAQSKL